MKKIIALIVILLSLAFFTSNAKAWWNSDWLKMRNITINYTGSMGSVANASVLLNITYDSDMLSDYSDLRFINGTTNQTINFWIENYTSGYAMVWVNVNVTNTSTATIDMYYKNNTAVNSLSNGTNTLPLFDDFNGAYQTLPSGWTYTIYSGCTKCEINQSGTGSLMLGFLSGVGGCDRSGLSKQFAPTSQVYMVSFKMNRTAMGTYTMPMLSIQNQTASFLVGVAMTTYHGSDSGVYHAWDYGNWDTTWHTYSAPYIQKYQMIVRNTTYSDRNLTWKNETSVLNKTSTVPTSNSYTDPAYAVFVLNDGCQGSETGEEWIDWVYAANLLEPSPNVIMGSEESPPTPPAPVTVCGNGVCETGENIGNCFKDCGGASKTPVYLVVLGLAIFAIVTLLGAAQTLDLSGFIKVGVAVIIIITIIGIIAAWLL